ncbi:MAG: hypothetical protein K6B46_01615 [Opitutales bacterium]|nr:hypothetical protein [Opitutales bacterium]
MSDKNNFRNFCSFVKIFLIGFILILNLSPLTLQQDKVYFNRTTYLLQFESGDFYLCSNINDNIFEGIITDIFYEKKEAKIYSNIIKNYRAEKDGIYCYDLNTEKTKFLNEENRTKLIPVEQFFDYELKNQNETLFFVFNAWLLICFVSFKRRFLL